MDDTCQECGGTGVLGGPTSHREIPCYECHPYKRCNHCKAVNFIRQYLCGNCGKTIDAAEIHNGVDVLYEL